MPTLRVGAKARLALSPFCALLVLLLFITPRTAAAQDPEDSDPDQVVAAPSAPKSAGRPTELTMRRAGSTTVDLRTLPKTKPKEREEVEREEPEIIRMELPGGLPEVAPPKVTGPKVAAPAPLANFLGLDFANWGAGHPPDTVGDVGPIYYIQAVNTSIGIYRKSDGVRVAAFTFDTFMSQGNFGNLCDTDNFGDPVILYDTFEDRWVITDFAFQLDGSGNVVNPPGAFQCFAVSKTGDPVTGGWNFYSLHIDRRPGRLPEVRHLAGRHLHVGQHVRLPGGRRLSRAPGCGRSTRPRCTPATRPFRWSRSAPPAAEFTLLPSQRPPADGHAAGGHRRTTSSSVWQFLNAVSRLQVPRRLEQHLALHLHRSFSRDRARELGQRRRPPCRPRGATRLTPWPSAADDAEPVHEPRRRRVAVEHPHRSRRRRVDRGPRAITR